MILFGHIVKSKNTQNRSSEKKAFCKVISSSKNFFNFDECSSVIHFEFRAKNIFKKKKKTIFRQLKCTSFQVAIALWPPLAIAFHLQTYCQSIIWSFPLFQNFTEPLNLAQPCSAFVLLYQHIKDLSPNMNTLCSKPF